MSCDTGCGFIGSSRTWSLIAVSTCKQVNLGWESRHWSTPSSIPAFIPERKFHHLITSDLEQLLSRASVLVSSHEWARETLWWQCWPIRFRYCWERGTTTTNGCRYAWVRRLCEQRWQVRSYYNLSRPSETLTLYKLSLQLETNCRQHWITLRRLPWARE